MAERLRGAVRHEDVVARLGGDEFAAMLGDVPRADAVGVAERIQDALTTSVRAAGHELLVRASVGVATADPDRPAGEAVATAVIRMAQALDLDTVAEGIETGPQARMLRHLGYAFGQGCLYSRPLSPQDLAERATTAVPAFAALAVHHPRRSG
ncbi:diguanylate cyclase [Dactylosporangium sp. McL0621]|uniref:diguanylate cyclase n=1 Tax=Dactylosporangium sp. McL0621 TaxID=3415678 RepID=UPI003CF05418